MNIINEFYVYEERIINTTAPYRVETVVFGDENCVLVSHADMLADEQNIKVEPFNVSVKCNRKIKKVELLPHKIPIDFKNENGRCVYATRPLDIFDMYRIELE